MLRKATLFSEFTLKFLEAFSPFFPICKLLLKRFALQLLYHSLSPLSLHINTIKSLRLHVQSPPKTEVSAYTDMLFLRIPIMVHHTNSGSF